ncbi:MAG: sigma-70 family RNA polymerase sigma factor [Planctomycetaceae bacterium]|nr:sigma-70 family RNA polymerase sigma factor [Planctomycetaceae bacterium]
MSSDFTPVESNSVPAYVSAIDQAREGGTEEIGKLLEVYRGYLLSIASGSLSPEIGVKVAPSDIVQETMFKASTAFHSFCGVSESDLKGWLKQILLHSIVDADRHYRQAEKRDLRKEQGVYSKLEGMVDTPNLVPSPLSFVAQAERSLLVRQSIESLSHEDQFLIREKIFEKRTFVEIGAKLGCTEEAARKRWARAICRLELELRQHGIGFSSVG